MRTMRPLLKAVGEEAFPLIQAKVTFYVLFSLSTDRMRPHPQQEGPSSLNVKLIQKHSVGNIQNNVFPVIWRPCSLVISDAVRLTITQTSPQIPGGRLRRSTE